MPLDTTAARTFHENSPATRADLTNALAKVWVAVWRRTQAATLKDLVLLDVDASLIEVQSETKVEAAPTIKGGFGFHSMFCFADAATGRALAALASGQHRAGQVIVINP